MYLVPNEHTLNHVKKKRYIIFSIINLLNIISYLHFYQLKSRFFFNKHVQIENIYSCSEATFDTSVVLLSHVYH